MNCSRVLSMTNPALIDELKTLVEPGKVLTDADSLNAYGKDWTKHFAAGADCHRVSQDHRTGAGHRPLGQ